MSSHFTVDTKLRKCIVPLAFVAFEAAASLPEWRAVLLFFKYDGNKGRTME
jgi:hypothetical protein